jgi:hypothetical protein
MLRVLLRPLLLCLTQSNCHMHRVDQQMESWSAVCKAWAVWYGSVSMNPSCSIVSTFSYRKQTIVWFNEARARRFPLVLTLPHLPAHSALLPLLERPANLHSGWHLMTQCIKYHAEFNQQCNLPLTCTSKAAGESANVMPPWSFASASTRILPHLQVTASTPPLQAPTTSTHPTPLLFPYSWPTPQSPPYANTNHITRGCNHRKAAVHFRRCVVVDWCCRYPPEQRYVSAKRCMLSTQTHEIE